MKRGSFCLAALAGVLSSFGAARGDTISAGPFNVEVARGLLVRCNGAVIISGDRCVPLRAPAEDARPLVATVMQGKLLRKDNIIALFARDGRNAFRREVMVTPDAVHITFEVRAFGSTGSTHLRYELLSPAEALDGAAYTATLGAPRNTRKPMGGVFDRTKTRPHDYFFQTCVYLALRTSQTECTLDFNPLGAWQGESNYGDGWAVAPYHDGKEYHLAMHCSGARNGATFRGKIILRPGNKPYERLHANVPVAYTSDFPCTLALNFTDGDANELYQACGATIPSGKPFR
jgi:hypothetical protein